MFVTSSLQSARRSDGRFRRIFASTIAAVSLVVLSPTASAQFGGFGGQNTGLNSRDLSQYGDILALDDEQRDVVQILFEDFMQETQEITSKMRAQMESAREEMRSGGGDFTQFRTMAEEAGKKRAGLQERFLGDVRVILNEEQSQNWPRLERAIRRNQSLRRGFLSGERVDLTRVIPQIDFTETSLDQVNESLAQYEVDLDRAIVARDEAQTRAMGQVREIFQSGDDDALDNLFDKQRKLSVRVRDVNRRYAREIEGMLGADEKAAFSEAFRRASFPQVFRDGRGQRVVDMVLGYDDLSDEQRTSIEGIAESFGRDRSKLNERHIAAIEESEMSMSIRDMFRRGGRGGRGEGGNRRGGEREATPQDEVVQKKRELDAKAIENIERVLSEGQASRLEGQLTKIREQEREQRRGNSDGGRGRRDR